MAISVKLYGVLREVAPELDSTSGTIGLVDIAPAVVNTTADVLKKLEIKKEEVSHVFVNGKYSSLNKEVKDGAKVAFFPRDMGLLYHWYFQEEE